VLELVAIIGVGHSPLRAISPEVSYRESIFETAVKAYADAGLEPQDIDTFVSVTEDYI
jgi:acetyl-CoA C-acetyltransferase